MWVPLAGFLGSLSPLVSFHVGSFCWVLGHLVSACVPLSPLLWIPFAGSLDTLSPLVSLCLPSCGFLLPGHWAPCLRLSACLSLSPFMRVPFAEFLSSLSPLVSVSFFMRVAFAGFLGFLSPLVSLHVGSYCRVPELLVSACLPLSPFMWVAFAGLLVSHCLPSPGFLLRLCPLCGFLSPGSWAPCLRLSPFVSVQVGSFCRVPGHLVSACVPSSPFTWVPFAGFLGSLSPPVSLCPSCGLFFPGYWAHCLRLSPFVSLHVGSLARFLSSLSPLFSHCLSSSPCVSLYDVGSRALNRFVSLDAKSCRVSGSLARFCLRSYN